MQKTTETHTIFHVDVNSAFLSWSALKRLKEDPGSIDLREIPSAVSGDVKTRHGVVTAKSIPAKKYGVKTGEPVVSALKKCPQLILVESDFKQYRACSGALMKLLRGITPLLQQISIDEAWLDVTGLVSPEDREGAVKLAGTIRKTVREQLGFTVNVGVSTNKFLAKMASDFRKPDLTHTLYPDEIPEKLWPLPIGEMYGCGKATAQRLNAVGISTIGMAAAADRKVLQSLLGEKAGQYVYERANGIGSDLVNPKREQAKSISNELTLSEDVTRDNYDDLGVSIIRKLSKKVAERLQKEGLLGQTVTLQVKTSDFKRYSRQTALADPVDDENRISQEALKLADRLLKGRGGLFGSDQAVRLIGVGVSRLSGKENRQMDLFTWAKENQALEDRQMTDERKKKLENMLADVNKRFGEGKLEKGIR